MKIKNCKLKIILFFLSLALFSLHSDQARAEGISLSVSPLLLKLRLNPPAEHQTPIALQNQGDDVLDIEILFRPFRPKGETGQIEYLSNDQINHDYKDIFNKIQLTDEGVVSSHFQLGPKQTKNLELQVNIPKKEKAMDYYFSIIFLASSEIQAKTGLAQQASLQSDEIGSETSREDQNISYLNAGIAANILLSIAAADHPQAGIIEFSAPFFLQSGPVDFTLRVKNTGQHLITPRGAILIKNMFGQTIGKLDIDPASILVGSIRSLTALAPDNDGKAQTASSSSQLQPDKIRWQENFLLGLYTANLSLALSDKGPLLNQSIIFLALPIQLIISIIIVIIIGITITIRIKYRLKKTS